MPLTSSITALARISADDRERMFGLHGRYFSNARHDVFDRDLSGKDWIIILRDGAEIVGFSTLQLIPLRALGADRIFLFSGDTIVDREHWRDSHLAGCFGHFMLRLIAEHPGAPLHWFLISKGYRTYRFLPVFFNRFYPVHTGAAVPGDLELLHAIAAHKFGDAYDAARGLVRLNGRGDRLRPEMCRIPEGRRLDPHVHFFLARNPAYAQGDELACIAEISRANLNRRAWRVIEHTRVIWNE
ncbi:hypothetical protein LLG95_17545 [bacterium]|nr:hypothetical protein [bacterium]